MTKRIKLDDVAAVLEARGLNPAEEIVKILQGRKIEPSDDYPEGVVHVVEADVRLRFHNELLKYVAPQKKAVEVVDKTPRSADEAIAAAAMLVNQLAQRGLSRVIDVTPDDEDDDDPERFI